MVESESEVAHSCPTLCDSMDFIIAHQAPLCMGFSKRVLECVAVSFPRGSSQTRD